MTTVVEGMLIVINEFNVIKLKNVKEYIYCSTHKS